MNGQNGTNGTCEVSVEASKVSELQSALEKQGSELSMLQRKQTDADEALRGAQREAQRAQELQVQLFVFFLVFLSFFLVVVVVVVVVVVFVVVVVVMEQLFIPFSVFLLMTRSTLRLLPGLSLLLLLSWNSSSFLLPYSY